ncbi:MAG: acetyltransferase [Brumimicrobium sp.]|nr:acetyltransferase [Brumimicrobium sp.]
MLIIGAKGFAKEVLEVCRQNNDLKNLTFFDNVNKDIPEKLYERFKILKSDSEVQFFFKEVTSHFTIGIGNPLLRRKMYDKFINLGGIIKSTISPKAVIGNYGNELGAGVNIMSNVVMTSDIKIGKGVLINLACTIGHDTIIGEFSELSPCVNVSGNCVIGNNCFIGTGAIILPGVKIGNNTIVGAGAVVTKDLPENCTALGVPARVVGGGDLDN